MDATQQQLTEYYAIIIGMHYIANPLSHRTYKNLLVTAAATEAYRGSLFKVVNFLGMALYTFSYNLPISPQKNTTCSIIIISLAFFINHCNTSRWLFRAVECGTAGTAMAMPFFFVQPRPNFHIAQARYR